MSSVFRHAACFLVLALSTNVHAAPTGHLNDTGQNTCYDGANLVACTPANSGDGAADPRQDGRFGRDAAAGASVLPKTGAGAAGFDFTRVCMSGELEGQGACPASPALGNISNDWACTKDNVTNLIWSLDSGYGKWTPYATTDYPTAMNRANRCGFSTGWRLPTRRELLSIVNNGATRPAIDSSYFPNTQILGYWSADIDTSYSVDAWLVIFLDGRTTQDNMTFPSNYVRLVRSGQ